MVDYYTPQPTKLECVRHAGESMIDCPKCDKRENNKIALQQRKAKEKREYNKNSKYLQVLINLDYNKRLNASSNRELALTFISPMKWSDYSHNDTCHNIVKWCKFHGCSAKMVEVKGTYVAPKKVLNAGGNEVVLGTGYYRASNAEKGNSDVEFIYNGQNYYCEVKKHGDSQRPNQIRFQRKVESEGFIYHIVHSLDEFVEFFKSIYTF